MVHERRSSVLDLVTGRYLTPRGAEVPVDRIERRDGALFFAVPEADNPRLQTLECWVLPSRRLRVCRWTLAPDATVTDADFDYYVDFCQVESVADRFVMVDDYVDIKVWQGRRLVVDDVDELIAALGAGFIEPREAQVAVETAFEVAVELTGLELSVLTWLKQEGWN
ncbi:hypothetical protein GCM10022267_87570 [Lentzea roselyniae]|uniref:DUF402 domain-containing protein n=1 Tax=Lentzea roselyniae TaxID=531940 RepID=A0ABP7CFX5_9PSEU